MGAGALDSGCEPRSAAWRRVSSTSSDRAPGAESAEPTLTTAPREPASIGSSLGDLLELSDAYTVGESGLLRMCACTASTAKARAGRRQAAGTCTSALRQANLLPRRRQDEAVVAARAAARTGAGTHADSYQAATDDAAFCAAAHCRRQCGRSRRAAASLECATSFLIATLADGAASKAQACGVCGVKDRANGRGRLGTFRDQARAAGKPPERDLIVGQPPYRDSLLKAVRQPRSVRPDGRQRRQQWRHEWRQLWSAGGCGPGRAGKGRRGEAFADEDEY